MPSLLGPDSASTFSNSSSSLSSRGRRSGPSGRGRGKSEGRDLKPLPPPPTVGLFAVACAVYALGALSYASKSIHGRFPEDEDAETEMQDAGNAGTGEMPPPSFVPGLAGPPTASPNPTPISPLNPASMNFTLAGGADPHSTWGINLPESSSSRQAQTSSLNPHLHPLADKATPSNLLNLARAALLVHDESSLPASLDYLHAHMLTWLYLLHPSDSASSLTSCGFQGASTGVGSGGMTVVEQTIYKELGKCVSVARAMGLDLVDRPSMMKPRGAAFAFGRTEESEEEDEGMGIWEKEMRRRVWWQLMMFDQCVLLPLQLVIGSYQLGFLGKYRITWGNWLSFRLERTLASRPQKRTNLCSVRLQRRFQNLPRRPKVTTRRTLLPSASESRLALALAYRQRIG